MRAKIQIFIFLLAGTITLQAQRTPFQYAKATSKFEFRISYWVNMHHFLYRESHLQLNQSSSLLSGDFLKNLNSEERNALESTITFYKDEIHAKHFFYSDYMSAVANYLKSCKKKLVPPKDKAIVPLVRQLNTFVNVYKKHFWQQHYEQNKAILNQNLGTVKTLEIPVSSALSSLFKNPWQEDRIRVDISVYGALNRSASRNIPYSSLDPATVVMTSSGDLSEENVFWIELLFHEASHHLVLYNKGFVANTIAKVSTALEVKPPGGLWHAYLFYITGKITHQNLQEDANPALQTYMERFGVFSNIHPSLKKLDQYISGEKSLEAVTHTILKEIAN